MGFGRDRDEYPASSVAEAIRCARASSRRASPSPTHPIARLAETTERTHDGSRDASPPRRASRRPVPSLPPSSRRFPSAVGVLDDLATSAPGVAAAATSAAAFVLTANAARRAAYATGVSCATPILGVAWGLCATAGASRRRRAGCEGGARGEQKRRRRLVRVRRASRTSRTPRALGGRRSRRRRRPRGSGFFRGALGGLGGRDAAWDEGEMTLDAMLGTVLYAFIGRGVHSALPSDVSHPGAMRRNSMPANGAHYASGAFYTKVFHPLSGFNI